MTAYPYAGSRRMALSVAKIVGLEFERIAATRGQLTPHEIVKDAASPKSPIHDLFEWDNSKAGHAHRLEQARSLLREVRIVIEPATENSEEKTVRAFASVPVPLRGAGAARHNYEPTPSVLKNPEQRAFLIAAALDRLNQSRQAYADLNELAGVFAAIDAAYEKHHERGRAAGKSRQVLARRGQ